MTYRYKGHNYGPRRNYVEHVTQADVGKHVTLKLRGVNGNGPVFVSGLVAAVGQRTVTITTTVHPTGPWDRWESYDRDVTIQLGRVLSRA